MLPQAMVRWPQAFNICASSSVVVVLPFVPVIATTGMLHERQPSSSSPIVSMLRVGEIPRERGRRIDARAEHDHLVMQTSRALLPVRRSRRCRARASLRSSSCRMRLLFRAVEHGDARAFVLQQDAPPPCRSGPRRELPPFDPCSAQSLPQLQRGQSEQREDGGENPEPHDDGVFLPAAQLEMMMHRRHEEDAFAGAS